jgi:hypothetical protein
VSLLLKSELRLRLGPQHCAASIWRAGLKSRSVGSVLVVGDDDPVEQAIVGLLAQGHDLPAVAAVCLEDELMYYATLPAVGFTAQADNAAREYFARTVSDDSLLIQTSLAPCGRTWIAAALEAAWVDQLRERLGAHDIELRHIRGALFEDLKSVHREMAGSDGMVVMLRSEGATIVGLKGGCIVDISWERFDLAELGAVATRLRGYRSRFAHSIGRPQSGGTDFEVLLVPANDDQRELLGPLVQAHGWRLAPSLHALNES